MFKPNPAAVWMPTALAMIGEGPLSPSSQAIISRSAMTHPAARPNGGDVGIRIRTPGGDRDRLPCVRLPLGNTKR